jgi:predicted AAA+ superfamily ATPase
MLAETLREPAPGRIQLLTGPRQVGKTTLLLELARELGEAAIYMAGEAWVQRLLAFQATPP